MLHIAVVHSQYLDMLLDGSKTAEARLSKSRCAPFSTSQVGHQILFKQRSGPYSAIATISLIERHEDLKPTNVRSLKRQYNDDVRGTTEFWNAKRDARYAVFLYVSPLIPLPENTVLPNIPTLYGRGWLTLPNTSPINIKRRTQKHAQRRAS